MNKSSDPFIDFLIQQQPRYDEAILKDITPSSGWLNPRPFLDHLFEDARFLPKRLVSVYMLHVEKPKFRDWHIARRLGLKTKTVSRRLKMAWDIIEDSLKVWLKTLPINERRRERYKRHKTWREQKRNWWPSDNIKDRFRGVWPSLISDSESRSNWTPEKKLNCIGEPCDP